MNILIHKDGQQHGPYSREDIEEHLKSGVLSRDDLAWKEGQSAWSPLFEVLEGSTPTPPPKAAVEASQSSDASVPKTKTFAESVLDKAKSAARLTQKQAYRKKLELIELRKAHYVLGKKAYENGLLFPEYAQITSQIDTLRGEIAALRQEEASKPTSSLMNQAKGAANAATRTAKVEALTLKHNHLLTEFGSKLRENPNTAPSLSSEIDAAKAICANIAILDTEIEKLASKTFKSARRPFLVSGILIALLFAYIGFGWVRGGYADRAVKRELHQMEDQVAKQNVSLAVQSAELQREILEERKKEQEETEYRKKEQVRFDNQRSELQRKEIERSEKEQREREVQVAQQKLERQKLEIKREQEAKAAQARVETEKQQKMQTVAENARKDEIAKAQEQQQRSVFAADLFSLISLFPQATLSEALKQLNSSIELRGEDAETIKLLLQKRDYLKLVNYLCKETYSDYPSANEIDRGLRELTDKPFRILLKTTMSETPKNTLHLISFHKNQVPIVRSSSSWERHPDGIGYFHKWSLSDGPVIVFTENDRMRGPV